MTLTLLVTALGLSALSGFVGLFAPRTRLSDILSAILMVTAACFGFGAALPALFTETALVTAFPWPQAGGTSFGIDALSAFFLLPVFVMGALGSIYSCAYWPASKHRNAPRMRICWGLLISSLGLLVCARHAFVFLLGWEAMVLTAFFLIVGDDNSQQGRRGSLVYLVASHCGTLALFAFFILRMNFTGSFDLSEASMLDGSLPIAGIMFGLVLMGFGIKAGFMPLHFWLPEAHAYAPSHVSAMLSALVLKMGIYGIVRAISITTHIPQTWGLVVLALGAASSLLGVAFAIAQHDIKKLLAYHSIENIGIILLGLGMAMLGRSLNNPLLLFLGLAGCLFHVWNHFVFKSLLFFGAGAVLHATGTREMDRLGGLVKAMPLTALFFLVGAVAICGLPPLNGFISELFVFLAMASSLKTPLGLVALAIPVLAMTGALALACFSKVFGVVFLGSPRSRLVDKAHEASPSMLVPMAAMALLCVFLGFFTSLFVPAIARIAAIFATDIDVPQSITQSFPFVPLQLVFALLLVLCCVIGIGLLAKTLRARRSMVWDCGYEVPNARMQYTAASFARSIVNMFRFFTGSQESVGKIEGHFPLPAEAHDKASEPVLDRLVLPGFRILEKASTFVKRFQKGVTQNYILYILIGLLCLFATLVPYDQLWKLLAGSQ